MTTNDNSDFPGLRITVEFGATLPVTDYGNIRPLVRIEGIDPRGDVGRQIEIGLDTAGRGFAEIDGRFEQLISEIMSPASGKPGFTQRMGSLEETAAWARRSINKIAVKVKEQDELLKAMQDAVKNAPGAKSDAEPPEHAPIDVDAEYAAFKANLTAPEEVPADG